MATNRDTAHRPRPWWSRLPGLRQASVLYLLGVIIIGFGLWVPETFLTGTTFKSVIADQVVVAMLALAILVPLTAGAFDLSAGSMLAFSLVIISWFASNTGFNSALSAVIALAACAVVGFASGFVVVKLRVNSFIATLGMSQILSGTSLFISQNQTIVGVFSSTYLSFGRKEVFGLSVVVYYLAALALVLFYVLEFTPLGRRLFATGANPEAARLSGVATDRLVWASLVASAVLAGFAGLVYGAKVGSYSNTFGPPLLFPAFAAVFLGATQFRRRPNVWGTVLAVFTLAFGVKGLQLALVAGVYWVTPLFNGIALVGAVSLATLHRASRSRDGVTSDGDGDADARVTAGPVNSPPVPNHDTAPSTHDRSVSTSSPMSSTKETM